MRRTVLGMTAVLALAGAAPAVLAQGPPGGGGGGFNFAAFQKWRNQHKYTFQLSLTCTRGLMECERTTSTKLKPEQAKKILGVLTPLRKQPRLTQEEAKAAIQKLQKILDNRQLSNVDRVLQQQQQRGQGGGGGGGGFGGGPGAQRPGGGPGGPGGGRPGGGMSFDPSRMQNFNPFNPDRSSPMYDRNKERNDKLFAFLAARAAGKTDARLDLPQRGPGGGGGPGGGRPGQ